MSGPWRSALSGSAVTVRSRRRFVIAVVLAVAGFLVLTAALVAPSASVRFKEVVSDLLFVPYAALMSSTSIWRARRSVGRIRGAWTLMAMSGGSFAVAEILWFGLYDLRLADLSTPSIADVFYLGALPPAAVALILFPARGAPGRQRTRTILGSLVVGGAVLFVSRTLALTAIFPVADDPWLGQAVFVAYPIADVVLFTLAVTMLLRVGPRPPLHLLLLAMGFVSYSFADTVYAHEGALGRFSPGSLIDLAWAAGYLLFCLAALAPHGSDEPHEVPRSAATDRHTGISAMLVYVPLLAAVVVAAARPSPVRDPVLMISGIAILVLFGARQALLVIDNSRLRQDLEGQVRQLEARGSELRRLAAQNERILQSVADGVIGVDPDGRISFVNRRAAEMLGVASLELLSSPVHDLFHPSEHETADSIAAQVASALHSGTMIAGVTADFRGPSEPFPVDLAVGPIVEQGALGGAVLVFRDVSARRAVEKMKDEFVSVVSHELRTPLTSIRGSLGLIASGLAGPLNARGQRMATIALESSKRLTRLIEEMLDLERIESGTLRLDLTHCDADVLVDTALEEVRTLAAEHEVDIHPTQVRGAVRADCDRVVQTLTNLMGNAIKFSPPGAVVEVSAEPVNGVVEFAVTDHGRGIPADKLGRIFERFEQVDSSDSRALGGTGLGLTICRDIVGLHNGRIWASSELGQGSTFRFTLPAVEPVPVAAETGVGR